MANDRNYHDELILIGSPTLSAYEVKIDCKKFVATLAGSVDVPLVPDERSAERHIDYLAENYTSLVGFDVLVPKDTTLEPESTQVVEFTATPLTAKRLQNTYVHFSKAQS